MASLPDGYTIVRIWSPEPQSPPRVVFEVEISEQEVTRLARLLLTPEQFAAWRNGVDYLNVWENEGGSYV